MIFSNTLISWYLQNKRELPWRKTKNPYYIWISEIILQQTRVDQGLNYYTQFTRTFPTIFDLAKAKEETVLKLWQGLGYYSRARNLHFSAKYIVNELNGIFPTTYTEILKLKGVGDYTASAIASICYQEPTAVVDGNVYRVLSRYFAINTRTSSTEGIKAFKKLAQQLIDKKQPDTHNQAIMEFGAIQCKPKNPDCNACPLNTSCAALQKKIVDQLPVKGNPIKIKKRFFNYLVLTNPYNQTNIYQRKLKDIWLGLYQFPLVETKKEVDKLELTKTAQFDNYPTKSFKISLFNEESIVHKLSHQHLYVKFWILHTQEKLKQPVTWSEFKNYPVPILIENFVKEFKPKP